MPAVNPGRRTEVPVRSNQVKNKISMLATALAKKHNYIIASRA